MYSLFRYYLSIFLFTVSPRILRCFNRLSARYARFDAHSPLASTLLLMALLVASIYGLSRLYPQDPFDPAQFIAQSISSPTTRYSTLIHDSSATQSYYCAHNYTNFYGPFRQKLVRFSPNITFSMYLFAFGRDIVSQEILSGRGWDLSKSKAFIRLLHGESVDYFVKNRGLPVDVEKMKEEMMWKQLQERMSGGSQVTPAMANTETERETFLQSIYSSLFNSKANNEKIDESKSPSNPVVLRPSRRLLQSPSQMKYQNLQAKRFGNPLPFPELEAKLRSVLPIREDAKSKEHEEEKDEESDESESESVSTDDKGNESLAELDSNGSDEIEKEEKPPSEQSNLRSEQPQASSLRAKWAEKNRRNRRSAQPNTENHPVQRERAAEPDAAPSDPISSSERRQGAFSFPPPFTPVPTPPVLNLAPTGSPLSTLQYWSSKYTPMFPTSQFTLTREAFSPSPANRDVIFLDIGSNVGWFSLLAASLDFTVFAIEPLEMNVQLFRRSICLNGAKNFTDRIHFLPIGLSESRQVCHMYSHSRNQGDGHVLCKQIKPLGPQSRIMQKLIEATDNPSMGVSTVEKDYATTGGSHTTAKSAAIYPPPSAIPPGTTAPASRLSTTPPEQPRFSPFAREYRIRQTIELYTLDEVLLPYLTSPENRHKRVGLVKIDVEGFEFHILKGAIRLLKGGYLPLICMEFAPRMLQEKGSNPLHLLGLMNELGYQIRWVKKNFDLHDRLTRIDLFEQECGIGAVCEIFLELKR